MKDKYSEALNRKLDQLSPGVSERLRSLDGYSLQAQRTVVGTLLQHACESQNTANIAAARNALAEIPPSTLIPRLNETIPNTVDFADEWGYRRLLELLRDIDSDILFTYVARGLESPDPEIREVAEDFQLMAIAT